MEDTAKSEIVLGIAALIDDHNGIDTTVLDIKEQSSWTDYFVISTVSSYAHMKGVVRYLRKYLSDNSVDPLNRRKSIGDEGWMLIDCGNFVIHLMSPDAREFYELERLWFAGKVVYHSSKSS